MCKKRQGNSFKNMMNEWNLAPSNNTTSQEMD